MPNHQCHPVIIVIQKNYSTTAVIRGSQRSEDILQWQSEKIDKSILLLSVEELQIINDAYFERIDDIINKYL